MTMDTAYGAPGAQLDYNWLRLLRRADAATPRARQTLLSRLLQMLSVGAVAASPGASVATQADLAPVDAAADQSVIELRQYTLQPGQRDTLIALFEREFLESQEQTGLRVLGQFRDLDNPDRFVWLRSFASMPARKAALESFYGGPVWQQHREAANATMIDSDNVLLLKPAHAQGAFVLRGLQRAGVDAVVPAAGLVVATLWHLQQPATPALLNLMRTRVEPLLRDEGATVLASLVTETAENTFPRLPVRSGEYVLVVFAGFAGDEDHARFRQRQAASEQWQGIQARLQPYLKGEAETLRLEATPHSLLRGKVD